jgi:hypothetical protein
MVTSISSIPGWPGNITNYQLPHYQERFLTNLIFKRLPEADSNVTSIWIEKTRC